MDFELQSELAKIAPQFESIVNILILKGICFVENWVDDDKQNLNKWFTLLQHLMNYVQENFNYRLNGYEKAICVSHAMINMLSSIYEKH